MQVIVQKFELGLYRPLELIYYRLGMYLSDTNIVLRLILWAAACVTRVAAVLLALPFLCCCLLLMMMLMLMMMMMTACGSGYHDYMLAPRYLWP